MSVDRHLIHVAQSAVQPPQLIVDRHLFLAQPGAQGVTMCVFPSVWHKVFKSSQSWVKSG